MNAMNKLMRTVAFISIENGMENTHFESTKVVKIDKIIPVKAEVIPIKKYSIALIKMIVEEEAPRVRSKILSLILCFRLKNILPMRTKSPVKIQNDAMKRMTNVTLFKIVSAVFRIWVRSTKETFG